MSSERSVEEVSGKEWDGWLSSGDVIRSHDNGYAITTAAESFFIITKISGHDI